MASRWTAWAGLVLLASGCVGPYEPVGQQRWRAQYFDPYPQNEPAPALREVRPPDYEMPPAEPVRAQAYPQWTPGPLAPTPLPPRY